MTTPLVLIHGWAGSAESWHPLIDHLDPGRWDPVIAIRLPGSPGYAGSAPPRIVPAAAEVADVVSSLPKPALIVGHSMGAQVSLLAHGLAPDATLGEVVIDPAYGPSASEKEAMEAWASHIDRNHPAALTQFFAEALAGLDSETVDNAMDDLSRTPSHVVSSYLRSEYVDEDAIGLEPSIRAAAARRIRPVLAVHSNSSAAAFERSLVAPPGSRVDEWPGFHHFLHLEDPRRFAALLDRWGQEVSILRRTTAAGAL